MARYLDTNPDPYARRFRLAGWTRTVTIADDPGRLRARVPEFASLTRADHIGNATRAIGEYVDLCALHAGAIGRAESRYGTEGTLIAGGFRDHWPAHVKDRIRELARLMSARLDRAYSHWIMSGRRAHTFRRALDMARRTEPGAPTIARRAGR